MTDKLTPELQKQIIKEANSSAANFHYYPGSEQFEDMGSAYESGAFKYAEKWQEEKERADRYEKALKAIAKPIAYLQQKAEEEGASLDGYFAQELARSAAFLQSLADEALTPKTNTDERGL